MTTARALLLLVVLLSACGGVEDCPDLDWLPEAGLAVFHCECGDRWVRWSDVRSCEDAQAVCQKACTR